MSWSMVTSHEPMGEFSRRLPQAYVEPSWYAAYTSANHEKKVAEQLAQRSVEHILPLYAVSRRWKDRWVHLQLPLFPGYVFVHLALQDRLLVSSIPGVACLVGTGRTPTAIPHGDIASLRLAMGQGMRVQPHPYLTVGRRVRITAGVLSGYEGVLIRRHGKQRVVLSIDLIRQSMVVDADEFSIEPVQPPKTQGRAESAERKSARN